VTKSKKRHEYLVMDQGIFCSDLLEDYCHPIISSEATNASKYYNNTKIEVVKSFYSPKVNFTQNEIKKKLNVL
jgi:hypothetical protein